MRKDVKGARRRFSGKAFRRLMRYIAAYRLQFSLVLLFILISAGAGVMGSVFLRTVIDGHITPLLLAEEPDFSGLLAAVTRMAGVYLAGILTTYLYNRMMVVIAQGVLKTIRDDMFAHMQTLPIRYFDTHAFGDIMSHYTNDTDALRQMIAQSIPQIFSSIVTVASVFIAMLYTSVWLTLFVLAFLALVLRVVAVVGGRSGRYFFNQQEALGNLNGYIEEMINGQKVIKVFCHERRTEAEFDRRNEILRHQSTEANKFANMLMPIMGNLGYLQYVLLAIAGGTLAIGGVTNLSLTGFGTLTLGMIASFLNLSRSFSVPLNQTSAQLNMVAMALAGAERIFSLMDEERETDEGYVTLVHAKDVEGVLTETPEKTDIWAWRHPHSDGTVSYTRLAGEVRFYDVDFGYSEDEPVLHGISLYAEPGQKLAFVGATGAGKTTITSLINRFYDIADGKVRYDGININKIKKADLRHSLGVVLQDVSLFTGTVLENIRYGKLDATEDEVREAARLANADDFINRLPDGYDTVLFGDGGSLSQGQRQLISIARAAVADPPVMILDEATSSIDTRTEAIVQKGMDSLMKDRTVFVIAHRLSTVRNSDAIIVLDRGRIIERGSHETLLAQKGTYYQLYPGAFELE
jgi:ATP-binding cassette subfamily B protein